MAIAARTRTLILTLLATAGLSVAASPSFPGADEAGPRSSRPIAEATATSRVRVSTMTIDHVAWAVPAAQANAAALRQAAARVRSR